MDVHPQPRNQPLVPLLALLMGGATLVGASGCLSPPLQALRSRGAEPAVAAQPTPLPPHVAKPAQPPAKPTPAAQAEMVAASPVPRKQEPIAPASARNAGLSAGIVLASNEQPAERPIEARPERDSAEPERIAPDDEAMQRDAQIKAEYQRVEFDDTPAVPMPSQEYLIDLTAALRLANSQNPSIALAQETVRELGAAQLAANALMLPTLIAGGNYDTHRGALQQSAGRILNVNRQSLYFGAGSRTLAAESVAFPGLRIFGEIADAVYEPLAAAQMVSAGYSESMATQNDILLNVSEAYLGLVAAEEQ